MQLYLVKILLAHGFSFSFEIWIYSTPVHYKLSYAFCYDLLVDAMLLKWAVHKGRHHFRGGEGGWGRDLEDSDVTTFQKKLQLVQMIFDNFYWFLSFFLYFKMKFLMWNLKEKFGMVSSFLGGSLNWGQSMTWGREGSITQKKVVTSSMDNPLPSYKFTIVLANWFSLRLLLDHIYPLVIFWHYQT